MIGTHVVTVADPNTPAVTVDLSCFVDRVSIHYGRDDTNTQPDASSATLEISYDAETETLPAFDISWIVSISTITGGDTFARFVGRVADISQGWDDAGEDTPDRPNSQVIAVGYMADLGRRVVGEAPWPQQLDGARVAAVLSAAGVVLNPVTSDPGTVQILARDVDSQPALEVAQGTAGSAGGVVWATRAGDIRYADANHRYGTTAKMELDACDVLVTPTWKRTTEGLINNVSIGYGVAADGGEQPRYVDERADSIEAYGEYGFTVATELAALADAAAMGQSLLVSNRAPVWIMSELPVDVGGLNDADTAALLSLEMHDLISLIGLPAAGSAPTSAYLWVEGMAEELEYGFHGLTLVVSGYCRTAPPPTWDNVPSAWTWDTVSPPSLTWDDAACFGPLPSENRWNDVPASLRWDQIDPSVTWDNYAVFNDALGR